LCFLCGALMVCRPFGTRRSEGAARNATPGSRVIFHAYLGRHPYPAFSWTEGHSASIHRVGMFVLKDTRVPGFLGHLTLVLEPTRFSAIPTVLIRGTQPRCSKYLTKPAFSIVFLVSVTGVGSSMLSKRKPALMADDWRIQQSRAHAT
jgi:hypothetical protein